MTIDSKAIYKRVRINRIRLDACPKHRFDVATFAIKFGAKSTCLECGGEMSVLDVAQYVRGYGAAGGDPNDVLPGFYTPENKGKVHCPQCYGKGFIETPGGLEDCDICEATGMVAAAMALEILNSKVG